MSLTKNLANNLRELHFGGNWTASNLREVLNGVTWQQANYKIEGFNTIVALEFHINYYVTGILNVYEGRPLGTKDALSFDHEHVGSQADWEAMISKNEKDVESLAQQIEIMPESKCWETFEKEEYGTYFRNIMGLIEHSHYHLGQIVILKKLVQTQMDAESQSNYL